MLELTNEQRQAIREHPGRPVRVVDPQSKEAFVLVPEAVFEKLREGFYDDSPWTDEEMDLLLQEDADALGWEGMDAYQDDKP
jgi:hypothetical protein